MGGDGLHPSVPARISTIGIAATMSNVWNCCPMYWQRPVVFTTVALLLASSTEGPGESMP